MKGQISKSGLDQGGRSCTGARVAPAEKFGLGRNFKPKHTLFCRELRFVAIYSLFFGDSKKSGGYFFRGRLFLWILDINLQDFVRVFFFKFLAERPAYMK